jgi:hypothetical protein
LSSSSTSFREALTTLLNPVRLENCPISRTVRRRIERFIFALDNEGKGKSKGDRENNLRIQPIDVINIASETNYKSICVFLDLIRIAKNAAEVEVALKDVTVASITAENPDSSNLKDAYDVVNTILGEGSKSGTAKLKRKLKRLTEMIEAYRNTQYPASLELQQNLQQKNEPDGSKNLDIPDKVTEPGNFPYVVFVGQVIFSIASFHSIFSTFLHKDAHIAASILCHSRSCRRPFSRAWRGNRAY